MLKSLSVLCHFVALYDCIRSGSVGGQLVITGSILSSFFHHNSTRCYSFLCYFPSASMFNERLPAHIMHGASCLPGVLRVRHML